MEGHVNGVETKEALPDPVRGDLEPPSGEAETACVFSPSLQEAIKQEVFQRHLAECVDDGVESVVRRMVEESVRHVGGDGRRPPRVDGAQLQAIADTVQESIQEIIQDIDLGGGLAREGGDPRGGGQPDCHRPRAGADPVPPPQRQGSAIGGSAATSEVSLSDHFLRGLRNFVDDSEGPGDSWNPRAEYAFVSAGGSSVRPKVATLWEVGDSGGRGVSPGAAAAGGDEEEEPGSEELKLARWREAGRALRQALSHISSHKKREATKGGAAGTRAPKAGESGCGDDSQGVVQCPAEVEPEAVISSGPAGYTSINPDYGDVCGSTGRHKDAMNEMWQSYQDRGAGDGPQIQTWRQNGAGSPRSPWWTSEKSPDASGGDVSKEPVHAPPRGGVGDCVLGVKASPPPPAVSAEKEPTLAELSERLSERLKQLTSQMPLFASTDVTATDKGRSKDRGKKSPRSKRHRRLSNKDDPGMSSSEEDDAGGVKTSPPRGPKHGAHPHHGHTKRPTHCHRAPEAILTLQGGTDPRSVGDHYINGCDIISASSNLETKPPKVTRAGHRAGTIDVSADDNSLSESLIDKKASNCSGLTKSESRTLSNGICDLELSTPDSMNGKSSATSPLTLTNHRHAAKLHCPAAKPFLRETDSVANFADVESAQDSGREKEAGGHAYVAPSSEEEEQRLSRLGLNLQRLGGTEPWQLVGVLEGDRGTGSSDSLPSLLSLSSDENHADRHNISDVTPDNRSPGECVRDDLDLSDDLPDLTISDDSNDEANVVLSHADIESLPEVLLQSSGSEDEEAVEDAMDADDEFECDCFICQSNRETDPSMNFYNFNAPHPDGNDTYEPLEDSYRSENYAEADLYRDYSPVPISLELLRPWDFMVEVHQNSELLEVMFQNVIVQMLSVYPDLLTDAPPAPITPEVFDSFPLISMTQLHKDEDAACPICLCVFELAEKAKELPCSHVFHVLCIRAWLQKAGTCPVCRKVLTGAAAPYTEAVNTERTDSTEHS